MILEVRDLVTAYGLSLVIHGVSLDVETGEVVCLLGRNGAGKTTTRSEERRVGKECRL